MSENSQVMELNIAQSAVILEIIASIMLNFALF